MSILSYVKGSGLHLAKTRCDEITSCLLVHLILAAIFYIHMFSCFVVLGDFIYLCIYSFIIIFYKY